MMGIKGRWFAPLPPVSLQDPIPPERCYRLLERPLDLGFVRGLVRGAYADIGRPSLDPVVFFKPQFVPFFEGLRSARQLLRVVADRPSSRRYPDDGPTAPLPDHSGPNRIRERSGLEQVNGEALPIASGPNLTRLLNRRGWGQRPRSGGEAGVVLPAPAPTPQPPG